MIIETNSAKETWYLGYKLGMQALPGQIFTLVGDLGVGKTVFTQGMAEGLGITSPVSSPTFTIIQEYYEGRWANLIEELMPEQTIWLTIEKDLEKGFDYRKITIEGEASK